MSNTTDTPRESGGGNRRRRSRGGQKRRQNNNQSGGDNREPRQNREHRGSSDGNRRQGGQSGKPRRNPMPKPAKLSWWQKLLKAIGLYKEPVKPARKQRTQSDEPRSAPKSNTRVARGAKPESVQSGERDSQEDRPPRKSRQRSETRSGGDPSSVESARVYVGNLSYDATEQDIKELFKGIGSVRNVEIVYDRKSHRSKGFGFVEMIHVDEAKRAVEVLHDQFFMGREMVVSGAQRKGQDEREEQEDVRNEKPKPVELAPLPPAAAVEPDPTEKAPDAASEEPPAAEVASTDIVTPVIVPPAETVEAPAAEKAPTIEEAPAIAEAPAEEPTPEEAPAAEESTERKPEA
ncbi:MAG: hypothetical protein ACNA8L_12725 [Luteolibacter sp.]